MIVYLVKTNVDWGTWVVEGVFSTRDKAERHIDDLKAIHLDDMEIEEWKVDTPRFEISKDSADLAQKENGPDEESVSY